MRKVTKEEFFKVINPLNVHPRVDVRTLRDEFIVSQWEMQDGMRRVVGSLKSGNGKSEYFLNGK